MRIVAGNLKGKKLHVPADKSIRPTSDRVREALFNVLGHGIPGFSMDGAKVLDLFAGSGALGLEALSRGARFCLFIDNEPQARALIRRNIEHMNLAGAAKIWRRDAAALGDAGRMGGFDLLLVDPPYGRGLGEKAVAAAIDGNWLAGGAIIVLEESAGAKIEFPDTAELLDKRRYGSTQILIGRAAS